MTKTTTTTTKTTKNKNSNNNKKPEQLVRQPSRDSLSKRHNIHARLIFFPEKLTDEEHKQKANKRQHKFTLEKERIKLC